MEASAGNDGWTAVAGGAVRVCASRSSCINRLKIVQLDTVFNIERARRQLVQGGHSRGGERRE